MKSTSTKRVFGFSKPNTVTGNNGTRSDSSIFFEDIPESDFEKAQEAISAFPIFIRDAQMFNILSRNFTELISTDDLFHRMSFEQLQEGLHSNDILVELNRAFVNFLLSMRLWLDHVETRLVRRYSKSSKQYQAFKATCAAAYDAHVSYRFLYELRNYAQHCGLPINSVNTGGKLISQDSDHVAVTRQYGANRDTLLIGYDWRKLTKELAAQPPLINVIEHSKIMMQDLASIHDRYMQSELDNLREGADFLIDLLKRFDPGDELIKIGTYHLEVTMDGDKIDISSWSGSEVPWQHVQAASQNNLAGILVRG